MCVIQSIMAEDRKDQSIVPLGNHSNQPLASGERALTEPAVSLQEIKDCVMRQGVLIPAGEGKQPVRILPIPAYYRWEHGFNLVEVDIMKTRKSPPVFIATYLIGIGDQIGEVRSIRLPVRTKGVFRETEDEIIRQMVADGLDRKEIEQNTPEYKTSVASKLGGRTLIQLARALKYGHFETSGVHREYFGPGNPEGRLQSGWKEDDRFGLPLVIWSNWKAPICVEFGRNEEISWMGHEPSISPPFTQEAINSADSFTSGLLTKIINKNQGKGGLAKR